MKMQYIAKTFDQLKKWGKIKISSLIAGNLAFLFSFYKRSNILMAMTQRENIPSCLSVGTFFLSKYHLSLADLKYRKWFG